MKRSLFHVCLTVLLIWGSRDLLRHWDEYAHSSDADVGLLILRLGSLALAIVSLVVSLLRRGPEPLGFTQLRRLVQVFAVALLMASWAYAIGYGDGSPWLVRSWFFSGLHLAQSVLTLGRWTGMASGETRSAGSSAIRTGLDRVDLVITNVLVCLLVGEALAIGWARVFPTPLLFTGSAEAWLETMRRPPHAPHFDRHLNSGGYPDDEFFVGGEGDLIVAVLADSFGLGVVPIGQNFVTLAEQALEDRHGSAYRRVAVHNFGIPAIGLSEYALVLEHEAHATRPSITVLMIFVGNDIHEGIDFGRTRSERYAMQEWVVVHFARRVWRYLGTDPRDRHTIATLGIESPPAERSLLPDVTPERPTLDEERFLEIEGTRLEVANPENRRIQKRYASFFRGLEHFRDELEDRLLVLLIPDEFQVNDRLFATLLKSKSHPDHYDRDLPQMRILEFCRRRDMDCVDLLPALRLAEEEAPTYHLRDTHWNAHGNRVAGIALAQAIDAKLDALGD
jgi:hypothetical protein